MGAVKCLSVILCLYLLLLRTSEADSKIEKPSSVQIRRASSEENEVKSVILTKGDTLRLECEFPAQPWSYVQWVKLYLSDGYKHSAISANESFNNGSLKVSSIVLENVEGHDTGNYSCLSTITLGGATKFDFVVAVKDQSYCEDNLCTPHGKCQELFDGYLCNCNSGYIGKHCERQDPCMAKPCLNNGSCTWTDDRFNCTCANGYDGEICEREVCLPNSCDGGSCSVTDEGKVACSCQHNRAGKRCQHRCTFNNYRIQRYGYRSCRGKTCVISTSGHERCQCNTDTNHCMMEYEVQNECSDPNICNKRGSCRDYTYQYRCDCQSYASGKNCEFFNECSSDQNNVCRKNGATCVDLTEGYKCGNCPPGQTGDKCQYKENPCTVTCSQTKMNVECDLRFLDKKLRDVPIHFNSRVCEFERNEQTSYYRVSRYLRRTKSIYYTSCGTEVEYGDDYITYRNSLQSGDYNAEENKNDIISRVAGYFLFKMECKIPLLGNSSSTGLSDLSLRINETADLYDSRKIVIPTRLQFFKANWQRISSYIVGDRLYAQLSATVPNSLLSSHVVLVPVTCFATSDEPGHGRRYFLLQNGCIKDETFRFEKRPPRHGEFRSYFSFESFAFKENPGKFYLHCDTRVCLNRTGPGTDGSSTCERKCQETEEISDEASEQTLSVINATLVTTQSPPTRVKRSLQNLFNKLIGSESEQAAITRLSKAIVEPLAGHAFA